MVADITLPGESGQLPAALPKRGASTTPPDENFLRQCIHCGICLPVCPTYNLTLREISSPRGRLRMMRNVADGIMPLSETFMQEMFFCLDCRACETACPAGVNYGALVESARAQVFEARVEQGTGSWLQRIVLRHLFTSPARLRFMARGFYWLQRSGLWALVINLGLTRLLGARVHAAAHLAPRMEARFTFARLPHVLPARGTRRFRVGLLVGCVQDVAFAAVNEDTAEVLRSAGCEVVVPRDQRCCGSLHGHSGDTSTARQLAGMNIKTFEALGLDAVIVNAAGCGSFMKAYDRLLEPQPELRARAEEFSRRVKDFSEFLVEIGLPALSSRYAVAATAYHDACHLAHGQRITHQPRELVRAVVGDQYRELVEADWCCGSAGIYNLTHPATARELLDRKIENLVESRAERCIAANPGCLIQLRDGIKRAGLSIEVLHPATLLRRALAAPPTS